ncbi:uncharacterized protein LOC112468767, partial [Temnothorax curvispinosus]|uniref:Uncharacterized protein LOC112468767 n=1 Tax=Temnothorax curvispinosus TaxID=300111 RepID=A0A6J1RMF7_9HYME
MTPIAQTIFWISFLYIAAPVKTARILAIVPIPSYSHQICYQSLWIALSQRGHEVVLITTDPINDPSLTNLTEINFQSNYQIMKKFNFAKNVMAGTHAWLRTSRTQIWPLCGDFTENMFKHPKVRKMYAPNNDEKFDLVIVEVIKIPSFYALAHRFNAPLIGVSSLGLRSTDYYLLGAPVLSSHPSVWEIEDDTGLNLSLWRRINNFIRQCQQEALSFVRPTMPNILVFGNFHISKKPA